MRSRKPICTSPTRFASTPASNQDVMQHHYLGRSHSWGPLLPSSRSLCFFASIHSTTEILRSRICSPSPVPVESALILCCSGLHLAWRRTTRGEMAERGQTQLAGLERRADDEKDDDDEPLGNEKAAAGSKSFEASEVKGKRITEMAAEQRRMIEERPSEQSQRQHTSKQAFLDSDSTTKATTTRKKAKRSGRDRRSCLPLCVPQRRGEKKRLLVHLSSTGVILLFTGLLLKLLMLPVMRVSALVPETASRIHALIDRSLHFVPVLLLPCPFPICQSGWTRRSNNGHQSATGGRKVTTLFLPSTIFHSAAHCFHSSSIAAVFFGLLTSIPTRSQSISAVRSIEGRIRTQGFHILIPLPTPAFAIDPLCAFHRHQVPSELFFFPPSLAAVQVAFPAAATGSICTSSFLQPLHTIHTISTRQTACSRREEW